MGVLSAWQHEPLPSEQLSACYKWIVRLYQGHFNETFGPQKLATLVRLGLLTKDDTSRTAGERYHPA